MPNLRESGASIFLILTAVGLSSLVIALFRSLQPDWSVYRADRQLVSESILKESIRYGVNCRTTLLALSSENCTDSNDDAMLRWDDTPGSKTMIASTGTVLGTGESLITLRARCSTSGTNTLFRVTSQWKGGNIKTLIDPLICPGVPGAPLP